MEFFRKKMASQQTTLALPLPLLLWLTVGAMGAVLFTIAYLIEGATRPEYNAWQQPISALSLGPGGWIQQVNFVFYGICVLCVAFAWRQALKGSVYAIIYPIIRGIEGLATIMAGFFSQDPGHGYPPGALLTTPTFHGEIHIISAFVIVNALALGFFVIAWRFAGDPRWRGWVAYSLISGVLVFVLIAFFGAGQNDHSVFAGYAGLIERLLTSIETIWEIVLLARLWTGTGIGAFRGQVSSHTAS